MSKGYGLKQLRGAWGAGFAEGAKKLEEDGTLVGCFFHTIHEGKVRQQGHVLSSPSDGVYLVQFFEWILGEPSTREVVRLDDMLGWVFYTDYDRWRRVGDAAGLESAGGK